MNQPTLPGVPHLWSVTLTVTLKRQVSDADGKPLYQQSVTNQRVEVVDAPDCDTARALGVERITAAIGTAESMAEELGASVKANAVKVKEV